MVVLTWVAIIGVGEHSQRQGVASQLVLISKNEKKNMGMLSGLHYFIPQITYYDEVIVLSIMMVV